MKRIFAIGIGVVVVFAIAMMTSVYRASQQPVTHTPGPLEAGRTQLHAQLEQARNTETQAEKQDWDSPPALHALVQAHEQRLEKLKDNREAAEIVAYDRAAIERLQKRITQMAEQEAAKAEAAKEARARQAEQPSQR